MHCSNTNLITYSTVCIQMRIWINSVFPFCLVIKFQVWCFLHPMPTLTVILQVYELFFRNSLICALKRGVSCLLMSNALQCPPDTASVLTIAEFAVEKWRWIIFVAVSSQDTPGRASSDVGGFDCWCPDENKGLWDIITSVCKPSAHDNNSSCLQVMFKPPSANKNTKAAVYLR